MPTIVSIEGGIGVGKSTALAALKATRPDLHFLDEPVEAWEEAGLLAAVYDGRLTAGAFQLSALMSRAGGLLAALRDHRVVVAERSPWSDAFVFAKANLEGHELAAYELAHDALMKAMPAGLVWCQVHLIAPVKVLQARMAVRGRQAEAGISDAYMKRLEALHGVLRHSTEATTTTVIDATMEAAEVAAQLAAAVEEVC
ncbi:MAG: hypothetical protein CMI16_04825 [Opitutaceae bacterium]|nr:hypothetical protein [Opitutaceae bacterium]